MGRKDNNAGEIQVKKFSEKKQWKSWLFLIGVVLIFILFKVQMDKQDDLVTIVMASHNISAGDVININEDMKPYKITLTEYNKLNNLADQNGDKLSPLVTADEVSKLDGKYLCNYIAEGTIVRRDFVTTQTLSVNPYLENIPDDGQYEIYTLPFKSDGVNTRLLLPGTNLRIRGVLSVKNEFVEEVRSLIEAKEKNIDKGLPIPDDGKSVVRTYAPLAAGAIGSNAIASEVPVAEILFDSIKVADILNRGGESILEILLALSNMPLKERINMLRTSVTAEESSGSNSFAKRITPAQLVLVVSRHDASQLAEFENLGAMNFKYTILAEDVDDSLYKQLRGVTDDIYSFIENYQAVK